MIILHYVIIMYFCNVNIIMIIQLKFKYNIYLKSDSQVQIISKSCFTNFILSNNIIEIITNNLITSCINCQL